jgi:hypothetical protein
MNELYTRKMIVVLSSVETTDVNFMLGIVSALTERKENSK